MVRTSRGRPTIADVAQKAGVGAITVSRYLRSPDRVSEGRRAVIADAIAALNYVPDLNARALASHRTDVVNVLVPSLTQNIFSDVLRGIYDGVEDSGLRIELANTRYNSQIEEQQVFAALRHGPAAIIVSGTEQTAKTRKMLENAGCPVIQIMDLTDDPISKIIGFSHYRAGLEMTRHLIASGYRRVGFLAGWMNARSKQRMQGYRDALEEANLFDPDLIGERGNEDPAINGEIAPVSRPFSSATMGRELMLEMLDRRPDVDAVFCNNDVLSLGALFALSSRDVRVPAQVGVAGFNDFDYMEAAHPSLSSVRIHRWKCGYEAMQAVRHQLEGGAIGAPIVDLGFDIMKRASTDRNGLLSSASAREAVVSIG
ncbi:LacI family DNA-binding transcriptional regulator [Devosia sp. BK]|uniref:LacI family DNA-binding transcriptional regulator n=1 Tax=Devosia sp. BK TaxID=2871706 RepID=UPI00293A1C9A|nr:LacI family DNA-binding transcriptional regulator [Devosia sp. BK]MDV3249729.1 LacI family DNA-binding transcriptional regulator [Devosia sp. BK]